MKTAVTEQNHIVIVVKHYLGCVVFAIPFRHDSGLVNNGRTISYPRVIQGDPRACIRVLQPYVP